MNESLHTARIRELSPLLANQIAAGEVVERPASVLKELVENSLDAGARAVTVEVEHGGVRLIRVRDDGCGVVQGDLPLALARHATSKIASLEDLEGVLTMGFRGEALPSIASVARVSITSRAAGAESAWTVRVEGRASATAPAPAAHPLGTTVEVRDLFFNTPARRRFLRTDKTEAGHIEEVLRRIALAHPAVAFTLRRDGREILAVRPASGEAGQRRRLARLCGEGFAASAASVSAASPDLELRGWLGSPGALRRQGDRQYLYVNGRVVRDAMLAHAVRQAYGERLAPGAQPAYVLELALDARQVDVNVHPAKHEVRFREARLVHDFVSRSLVRVLEGTLPLEQTAGCPSSASPPAAHPPVHAVREQLGAYGALHPPVRPAAVQPAYAGDTATDAVVAGRWLVRGEPDALLIVDLAGLRAREVADELSEGLAGVRTLTRRPVLVPVSCVVGDGLAEAAQAGAKTAAALGFDLRRTGPGNVALVEIPAGLAGAPLDELARVLCEGLAAPDTGSSRAGALVDALAAVAPREALHGLDDETRETLLARARALVPGTDAARGCIVRLDAVALAALLAAQGDV